MWRDDVWERSDNSIQKKFLFGNYSVIDVTRLGPYYIRSATLRMWYDKQSNRYEIFSVEQMDLCTKCVRTYSSGGYSS